MISPIFLRRLAIVLEKGAGKYPSRNWELGLPLGRYLNSALRHLEQALEGLNDEDHLGQASFNIMALMHTEEMINRGLLPKELDNLPHYLPLKETNGKRKKGTKGTEKTPTSQSKRIQVSLRQLQMRSMESLQLSAQRKQKR